jgi:hypothetical protein
MILSQPLIPALPVFALADGHARKRATRKMTKRAQDKSPATGNLSPVTVFASDVVRPI